MSVKNFILFFFILLVSTLVDYFYLGRPLVGIDDANIFMNYAWHLSQGEGFVFNHGGERVEGFTSLLWVLLIRFFYILSDSPEIILLSFLLLLATCTVSLVYGEVSKDVEQVHPTFLRKNFLWIFSAFLVCIGPSYVIWSVLSLMENGLWNFLFVVMIVLILQMVRFKNGTLQKVILVVAGILLLLTRPEAMLWCLVFTVILLIIAWKNRTGYTFPVLFFMFMAATTVAITLFRKQYFGYPLPNTFYAKVSDDEWYNFKEGLLYLFKFITNFNPLFTFFLLVLTMFLCKESVRFVNTFKKKENITWLNEVLFRLTIITSVIFISLVLPLATGGDHFGGFRFYQGGLLLFAWGIPALGFLLYANNGMQEHEVIQTMGIVLGLTFFLFTAGVLYKMKNITETRLNFEFSLASEGRQDAQYLNSFWPGQKPSVGLIAVGGFSLKYQGETVDLMGLNNTIMGHSKGSRKGIKNHASFNKEIFYQLHPDLLLPKKIAEDETALDYYEDLVNETNFFNKALKNIVNDSLFVKKYEPVILTKNDKKIFAFVSTHMKSQIIKDSGLVLTKLRRQ